MEGVAEAASAIAEIVAATVAAGVVVAADGGIAIKNSRLVVRGQGNEAIFTVPTSVCAYLSLCR